MAGGFSLPVNNITPPTVNWCATLRNRRDMSITRSVLLIWAFRAARCACRNRRTRCSGVSPGSRDAAAGFGAAAVAFEVACGMLDVNRVASLTLRGPIRDAMADESGLGRWETWGGGDDGLTGLWFERAHKVMRFFERLGRGGIWGETIGSVQRKSGQVTRLGSS